MFVMDATGVYVEASNSVSFYNGFVRGDGRSTLTTETISAIPGTYLMRIVNGADDGENRVRSGKIAINGNDVVLPCDFGRDVDTITVPVDLFAENLLEVELRGRPGGSLFLVLQQL